MIRVSEYRTLKCCWECGRELKHPLRGKMRGVSFCSETEHHHMLDRDKDAARKIGYRFLASYFDHDLGIWKYTKKTKEEKQVPIPGLGSPGPCMAYPCESLKQFANISGLLPARREVRPEMTAEGDRSCSSVRASS